MDSIDDMHRKLRLTFHFVIPSRLTQNSTPKNTTKEKWQPDPKPTDKIITRYITSCKEKSSQLIHNSRSFFNEDDNTLLTTLKRLKSDKTIIIKPADKNLGLVILNTDAYIAMCLTHLNDTTTYHPIDTYHPNQIFARLKTILNTHHKLYHTYQKPNTPKSLSPLADSLLQLQSSETLRVPLFYAIPKIHKTLINPPGRPIVSSISTATYYASVYLDKELQPVLRYLDTVCTSSQFLIKLLRNRRAPLNSIILCADVTALYPNIPIDLGLETVRNVLQDLKLFTQEHLMFLLDLLSFILKNNYCMFDNKIYHQLKGTAMGTPTAVSYSNIFLYGIEKTMLHKYPHSFYTRYIDDVFAIFHNKELAQQYINEFNSYCPSIKFEAVTLERTGIMLDLEITLHATPTHESVSHKLYQKERNIYQYIPTLSEHKPSLFTNFAYQELCRYKLNSTNPDDYIETALLFKNRLTARGYPLLIYDNAFEKIPSRDTLLKKIKLPEQLTTLTQPLRGNLLITLSIPRLDPHIPWSTVFKIPDYLSNNTTYSTNYLNNRVIIGSKNPPSIGNYLIRSKFTSNETPTPPLNPV